MKYLILTAERINMSTTIMHGMYIIHAIFYCCILKKLLKAIRINMQRLKLSLMAGLTLSPQTYGFLQIRNTNLTDNKAITMNKANEKLSNATIIITDNILSRHINV